MSNVVIKTKSIGTVIAIMAGYYILNGQAVKALAETNEWLKNKLSDPENIKE